jgi:hypothetical protein
VVPARGAPAAYRTYDVRVDFGADYVAQMYLANGQRLEIELRSDGGEVLALAQQMGPGRRILLRREERQWLSTLARTSCALAIDDASHARETTVEAHVPAPLAPRRRFDAVLKGRRPGKTEAARALLHWSFVSSAFADFADHLRLRGRVRTMPIAGAGSAWIAGAAAALAAGDPWTEPEPVARAVRREREIAAFTTLILSTEAEPSLPAVVELSSVTAGGDTWAMLLSSPEPLDWDRVALALTRRVTVVEGGGCLPALFGLSRPITSHVEDVAQPCRVLRDADGTRALLLALDGADAAIAFPAGPYTLKGSYARDAGPTLPILSKGGATDAEHATLQWTLPVT